MTRKLFGGYRITEMRRYATEYQIPGRSKMDGPALLAALHAYWDARRQQAEQAVINAATGPGVLLRHKSTGTIVRMTSAVTASDNPNHGGALRFHAEYVEIGEGDGSMVGAWKGRGVDRARYENEESARRVENGYDTDWQMLYQFEAVRALVSNYGTEGYEIRVGDDTRTEVRYYVDHVPGHGWVWWGIYGDMGSGTDDTLHNTRVLASADEALTEVAESYALRLDLVARPVADPEVDCMCTPCMLVREH